MGNIQFLRRLQHLVHHGGEVNHHHDTVLVCVVVGEQLKQEPEHLGVLSSSRLDSGLRELLEMLHVQLREGFCADQPDSVGGSIQEHLKEAVVELTTGIALVCNDDPDEVLLGLVESSHGGCGQVMISCWTDCTWLGLQGDKIE